MVGGGWQRGAVRAVGRGRVRSECALSVSLYLSIYGWRRGAVRAVGRGRSECAQSLSLYLSIYGWLRGAVRAVGRGRMCDGRSAARSLP